MGTFLSRLVIMGLSIWTFTGCATLIFDRYDKVDIVTEPAGVGIYDSEGFNIGITPVQIPFKRLPQQHLTLRMDGYVDTTVVMSTEVNPWSGVLLTPVVDVLLGGIFKKNDKQHVVRMKTRNTSSTLTSVETNHSNH